MNIIEAIKAMQAGHKVKRPKWKGSITFGLDEYGLSTVVCVSNGKITNYAYTWAPETMLADDFEIVKE